MGLAGTENTLAAQIKTDIEARILVNEGVPVITPNGLVSLSEGIANAVIPHFLSNVQILPGSFQVSIPAVFPVTGVGTFL